MSATEAKITLHNLYWLSAGVILAALPHATRIPIWLIVLFFIPIIWKILIQTHRLRQPDKKISFGRVLPIGLVLAGALGVQAQFGTIGGRDAGTALLLLLAGFKILETTTARDFYVAGFIGYFLVITNFLYTQSIGTAVYMAVTVLVMTVSLLAFNDYQQRILNKTKIRLAGTLLLQSAPLMLIAFLLFPRISGPLWGLPNDAYTGLSGIDDEMSPGSVSQLIQSNEVAFRVNFQDQPPPQSALYWRGPVLWHSDGVKWTRGAQIEAAKPDTLQAVSAPVTYTVTMEPHNGKWLYALDMPQAAPAEKGNLTTDFQLLTNNAIVGRVRYDLTSYPQYKITSYDSSVLLMGLQLPYRKHPKTIELVSRWTDEGNSDRQVIDRALKWFNEGDFYYTLTPSLLTGDRVDQFLFETKQGFCEHYTSAFVIMMRAAGIPARVVLGYQGGNYNEVGDYLVVRQRNAHAWAEVWLRDTGWIRVDPTAAVAPERVSAGIENALPGTIIDVPPLLSQNNTARALWQQASQIRDAINNQWNQWVISYGPARQREFFQQFGIENIQWSDLTLLLIVMFGVILLGFAFQLLRRQPQAMDPAKKLYDRFCQKLSRCGIRRQPSEGPVEFANRAVSIRHDLLQPIETITALYIATRYASQRDQLPSFAAHVRAFKPSARRLRPMPNHSS